MHHTGWKALALALLLVFGLTACGRSGGESTGSMPDESSISTF